MRAHSRFSISRSAATISCALGLDVILCDQHLLAISLREVAMISLSLEP